VTEPRRRGPRCRSLRMPPLRNDGPAGAAERRARAAR
jgi:hypothetical protein